MKYSLPALMAATAVGMMSSVSALAHVQDAIALDNNDSVLIDVSTFKIAPGKPKGDPAALVESGAARELGQGAIVFRVADKLYIIAPEAVSPRNAANPRRSAYDSAGRYVPDNPSRPGARDDGDPRRSAYDSAGRYVPDNPSRPGARDDGDPRRSAYDSAGRYVPDNPSRPGARDDGDPRRSAYDAAGRYVPNNPAQPFARDDADPRRSAYDAAGRYVPNNPAQPFARDDADPRRSAYGSNWPGLSDPSRVLIYDPIDRRAVYVNDPDYAQYRLRKAFEDNWIVSGAK